MMWFFAVLVVLVMGGVAAVAAGRGAPMSDAYDDRPDALVPSEGALGADDLRRVRFSLAFRGYRMAEVDALLDRVAAQLEETAATLDEPLDGADHEQDDQGQEEVGDTPGLREARGDQPPR